MQLRRIAISLEHIAEMMEYGINETIKTKNRRIRDLEHVNTQLREKLERYGRNDDN